MAASSLQQHGFMCLPTSVGMNGVRSARRKQVSRQRTCSGICGSFAETGPTGLSGK